MTDLLSLLDQPQPGRNLPEFTVGELASGIKKTLEQAYDRVRVRGEISQTKLHSSGHFYFSLKDTDAVIDGVSWKGSFAKLSFRPAEGMDVVITGRITTYGKSSKYQLIAEDFALAGQGALLQLLEARRQQLTAEGLFDQSRKRKLPYMPARIAIITSPTGAVIRDILHRLEDRFPLPVILWPVPVQGETAALQIANAISSLNALAESGAIPTPDVIIVARGGGSLEDLMPFNEEIVVRAAAASRIPLISAVGHETDTTLIDYAADLRAPTPTAAAELAVPVRRDLLAYLDEQQRRLTQLLGQFSKQNELRLQNAVRILTAPERLLEPRAQRLDDQTDRLQRGTKQYLQYAQQTLAARANRLLHPQAQVRLASERLRALTIRLPAALERITSQAIHQLDRNSSRLMHPQNMLSLAEEKLRAATIRLPRTISSYIQPRHARIERLSAVLEGYSLDKLLARGFVLIRKDGQTITKAANLTADDAIEILFADGKRTATIKA